MLLITLRSIKARLTGQCQRCHVKALIYREGYCVDCYEAILDAEMEFCEYATLESEDIEYIRTCYACGKLNNEGAIQCRRCMNMLMWRPAYKGEII